MTSAPQVEREGSDAVPYKVEITCDQGTVGAEVGGSCTGQATPVAEVGADSCIGQSAHKPQNITFFYKAIIASDGVCSKGGVASYGFCIPHVNDSAEVSEYCSQQFVVTSPGLDPEKPETFDSEHPEILDLALFYINRRDDQAKVRFKVVSLRSLVDPSPIAAWPIETPAIEDARICNICQWGIPKVPLPLEIEFSFSLPVSYLQPYAQSLTSLVSTKPLHGMPKLQVSLLEDAAKTGDVNLVCKDGSKLPAHAAVLASIPYFDAKLKEDWSDVHWNMHNKLDLELPCHVDTHVVHVFLHYAYGDPSPLHQVEPSRAPFLPDLLSLAEATGFTSLCASVDSHVAITDDNHASWLEWLAKEQGSDFTNIVAQATRVVKRSFEGAGFWEGLTPEQLVDLSRAVKRRKMGDATGLEGSEFSQGGG